MVAALASCSSDDEVGKNEEQHPIVFSSFTGEQEMVTRAETTLGHDFVVYGYKNVNGNEQTVFNGYTVKYLEGSANTSADNTHNYYYVEGEQSIKYWDFGATDYHFWGMWQEKDNETNKASFSGDKHNVLTIPNVPLRTGEPDPVDDVLFSSLVERRPVTANVVKLNFNHPYAKVRIQFYTTEPIETDKDNIDITNITFAPDPSATSTLVNKVYGNGTVKVEYPLTSSCSGNAHETVSVDDLSDERDNLPFLDVKLTQEYGTSSNNAVTAPINDSKGLKLDNMPGAPLKAKQRKAGEVAEKKYFYYPLPMGEKNPAFILKAYVNGDPEQKTAVVPAEFMQWKPNYQYTYIFKITEVPKKIEIYDVLIEPWHYGGSQEEEWKNW